MEDLGKPFSRTDIDLDVAIIGGGPAGSTVGALLRKYASDLRVGIFERETFPRDHIGESQLPLIARILDEMGAWDKVEAAGFPIKVGGTYRWGRNDGLWDIDFIAEGALAPAPRPGKYVGERRFTAFQVDRAIYDDILLRHAESMGCRVEQATQVREVQRTADRVDGLILADGRRVVARHYVDASGNSGILRRAMDVPLEMPSNLQNIAIWNYWTNAEWAVEIGVGGTRIQVLAQEIGWLWFIPLGPERTSIGLVVPVGYFKERADRPDELYYDALRADRIVSKLVRRAEPEARVRTTRDWSYISDRLTGENWFLVGECAGFADPILSAGMSLAHAGARDVAYTILAMDRGDYERDWLRTEYCINHRGHIRQHIRFADYWYSAHGAFTELQTHAQTIARDAGLDMTPEQAWQWIGQGGFIDSNGSTDVGLFGSLITKELIASFSGGGTYFAIEGKTHFRLDVEGAEKTWVADLADGRITRYRAWRRGQKTLPLVKTIGWLVGELHKELSYAEIRDAAKAQARAGKLSQAQYNYFWSQAVKALEALVTFGWVVARTEANAEACPRFHTEATLRPNTDVAALLAEEITPSS